MITSDWTTRKPKASSAPELAPIEVRYFGFKCRVVSPEWAELIELDRRGGRATGVEERMDGFLRTLEEIRQLPEAA